MIDTYAIMPILGELAAAWFAGALVEGLLIGLILSCVFKKTDCKLL